jgi:hypothetical protein
MSAPTPTARPYRRRLHAARVAARHADVHMGMIMMMARCLIIADIASLMTVMKEC